jgi:hypothetical protein
MPCCRYAPISSRTEARVVPMHEMCGATGRPACAISVTVFHVPSRVEPPAPKVTLKNAGDSAARRSRTARSLSAPSGVLGGKNSKL